MDEFVSKIPNGVPTYYQSFMDIYGSAFALAERDDYNMSFVQAFFYDVNRYAAVSATDYVTLIGGAIIWTLLRYILESSIFAPFAKSQNMLKVNEKKFPESAWKLVVYIGLWSLSVYTLFVENSSIFYHHLALWADWKPGMSMSWAFWLVYMLQCSFYLHSVYGTLFMDHRRKDTMVMLFHHFLTLGLIFFSYAIRYHKIGLFVLFVHDVTDICLEFTKLNVYMKDRAGRKYKFYDNLSTVGFLFFAITWFVFRLYWYPLKVLHSSGHGSESYINPEYNTVPWWYFFNSMLWMLLVLNIYWFKFIVLFLFRVLTGQMKEVEDVREEEVEEKYNNKQD